MISKNAFCSFCKALLEQRLVLDVEPEDCRINIPVPPRVSHRCLCFANTAKSTQNDCAAAAIATKGAMYVFELLLAPHKAMSFCNSSEAERNGEVLAFGACPS
jgi:hypothetical protein